MFTAARVYEAANASANKSKAILDEGQHKGKHNTWLENVFSRRGFLRRLTFFSLQTLNAFFFSFWKETNDFPGRIPFHVSFGVLVLANFIGNSIVCAVILLTKQVHENSGALLSA